MDVNKIPRRNAPRDETILKYFGSLHGICKTCGGEYRIKNLNQRFCSPECRASNKGGSGRWTVLHRDEFRCIYCGRAPWNTPDLVLHVDHIHPHSSGGRDNLSNLVTSCADCNSDKSDTRLKNEAEIKQIVEQRNREQELSPKRIIKLHR